MAKKNNKKLSKKQLLDIALASAMATGLIGGQIAPVVALATENSSEEEVEKNKILGISGDKSDISQPAQAPFNLYIYALPEEGYKVKRVETNEELKLAYPDDSESIEYGYTATETGVYTFAVYSPEGEIVSQESVNITIDPDTIIFELYESGGSVFMSLSNEGQKKFKVSAQYKGNSNDTPKDIEVIDDDPDNPLSQYHQYHVEAKNNGYYIFTVENERGERKTETLQVTSINDSAPVISNLEVSEIEKNKKYKVEFDVSDADTPNNQLRVELWNNDNMQDMSHSSSETHRSFIIQENGNYKLFAVDELGHQSNIETFDIDTIDWEIPDFDLSFEIPPQSAFAYINVKIKNEKNGVTVKADGIDDSKITFDEETNTAKVLVEYNGTYNITVTDAAGNIASKSIDVTGIPTKPEDIFIFTQYNHEPTRDPVSVQIVSDSPYATKLVVRDSKGAQIPMYDKVVTIDKNGTYYIEYVDSRTNILYKESFEITNIDNQAPIIEWEFLPQESKAVQKVKIKTYDDNDFTISYKDENNHEYFPDEDNIITFTENCYVTVEAEDTLGNRVVRTFSVNTINQDLPNEDLDLQLDYEISSEPFDVIVNALNVENYILYVNDKQIAQNESTVYKITKNGTYVFKVVDTDTGTKKEETIVVESIVEKEDTITLDYLKEKTNQDVLVNINISDMEKYDVITAMLDGSVLPVFNENQIYVPHNGTLVVEAKSTEYHTTISTSAEIDFINKEPISVDINYPLEPCQELDITFTPNDDRVYNISVNGEPVEGNKYHVVDNGTYDVYIEDEYGNYYEQSIQIENIDKHYVNILGFDYDTRKTNQNVEVSARITSTDEVKVSLYNKDEMSSIPVKTESTENEDGEIETTVTFTIEKNGNYLLEAKDEVNDITRQEDLIVDNINKEKPELSVELSETVIEVEEVMATVSVSNKENYKIYLDGVEQESRIIKITKNGSYTITVEDEYGNTADYEFEIKNINNTNIYITELLFDTSKTNKDVDVSVRLQIPENVNITSAVMSDGETSWELDATDEKNYYTGKISKNGEYMVEFTSDNGKTARKEFTVDNIFKGPIDFTYDVPEDTFITGETMEISVKPVKDIEGNLYTFKIKGEDDDDYVSFGDEIGADANEVIGVEKNGTYLVKMQDEYGNEIEKEIIVNNFTDEKFDVIFNYDDKLTNQDVKVSYTISSDIAEYTYKVLKNGEEIEHTDNSFIADSNGEYKIIVSYVIGEEERTFEKSINIENINKELPEIQVDYLSDITSKGVLLGITILNKDRRNCIITVNGEVIDGDSYLAQSNGAYVIEVLDEYGNKAQKIIEIEGIVDSPLTMRPVVENTDKTNQDVKVSLNIWSENDAPYTVTIEKPNGEVIEQDNITEFMADSNGTYKITVTNEEGVEIYDEVVISNINKEQPKLTIEFDKDTETPINTSINGIFSVTNKDKYQISVKDSSGQFLTPSFISSNSNIEPSFANDGYYDVEGMNSTVIYTFSKNDTYTVEVRDEYGNSYSEEFTIDNIVLEKPNLKVEADLENTTKELNVNVIVDNKDTYDWVVKNSNSEEVVKYNQDTKNFIISENGKYSITVTDVAGNTAVYEFEVTNIDKEAPIIESKYDTALTNKDVEATYSIKDASSTETSIYYFKEKPFEDNLSVDKVIEFITDKNNNLIKFTEEEKDGIKSGKFTLTDSGYYLILSKEKLGTHAYKLINVTNINKVVPKIEISTNTTKWTNKNVEASIKVPNKNAEDYKLYINGIEESEPNFVVYQNGKYVVKVIDKYGNEAEKTLEVNNIDKSGPTISVAYKTTMTNKNLIINVVADDSLSGLVSLKVTGKDGKEYKLQDNQIVLTKNDKITITAIDKVGNKTVKTYNIKNIDKTAPELSISYQDKQQSSNVPVKFNVKEANDYTIYVNGKRIKGTTYYASKNGKYTVVVLDAAGNKVEKTFTIKNLDKKGPTLKIEYDKTLTDKPIEVKYEAKDENGILKVTLDGKTVKDGKFTIKKNGTYTVRAYDKSGNVFSQVLNITNIDSAPPVIKSVNAYTEKLKTYISINATDDASGIKKIKLNGYDVTKIKDKIRVYSDGLYIIEVIDNYNKSTKEVFEIKGVKLKKYLPVAVDKRKDNDKDNTGASITEVGKEDANVGKDDKPKDEKVEITNNVDKIIFGTSTYQIPPQKSGYMATNQELTKWYEVQAPDGYAIDFDVSRVDFTTENTYQIPVKITSMDGAVLNHTVELVIGNEKVTVVNKSDKDSKGILETIGSIIDNDTVRLVAKILGAGAALVGVGAAGYYAFNESKRRQEASMANVLIIINGKPFTVERIKRTMNGKDLKNHLIHDILSEYFKNTKERVKITSIVPVDEELFSVSEKAMASKKGCSKIIYVEYEIKRDLR